MQTTKKITRIRKAIIPIFADPNKKLLRIRALKIKNKISSASDHIDFEKNKTVLL